MIAQVAKIWHLHGFFHSPASDLRKDDLVFVFSEKEIETLAETHDLCIGGDSIEMLQATSAVLRVIPFVKVYYTL